jgi:hypothetical protein
VATVLLISVPLSVAPTEFACEHFLRKGLCFVVWLEMLPASELSRFKVRTHSLGPYTVMSILVTMNQPAREQDPLQCVLVAVYRDHSDNRRGCAQGDDPGYDTVRTWENSSLHKSNDPSPRK